MKKVRDSLAAFLIVAMRGLVGGGCVVDFGTSQPAQQGYPNLASQVKSGPRPFVILLALPCLANGKRCWPVASGKADVSRGDFRNFRPAWNDTDGLWTTSPAPPPPDVRVILTGNLNVFDRPVVFASASASVSGSQIKSGRQAVGRAAACVVHRASSTVTVTVTDERLSGPATLHVQIRS